MLTDARVEAVGLRQAPDKRNQLYTIQASFIAERFAIKDARTIFVNFLNLNPFRAFTAFVSFSGSAIG